MPKYLKGDNITSISELAAQDFIYHRHKVIHKGWFHGWRFGYAIVELQCGRIFYAIPKDKNQPSEEGGC